MRRKPRQERSRDTVAVILEGTVQVLLANGGREPSMAAVAKKAGVSVGSIYQYFSTKEELIDAVERRLFDDMRDAASGLLTLEEPTPEHFRTFFTHIATRLHERQAAHRFLRARAARRGSTGSLDFEKWAVQHFAETSMRAGRAATVEQAQDQARSVCRALLGLTDAMSIYDESVDIDALVERLVAITRALAPPP